MFTVKPDTSFNPKDYSTLKRTPQINFPDVISAPKKWAKISGCFEAKEAYDYLTIGNFFNDDKTKFSSTIWLTGLEPYYLIDDVFLEETRLDFLPPPNLLGNDTTICDGQRLAFDFSKTEGYEFTWEGGSREKKFSVGESGTYAVRLTNDKCIVVDSVTLKVVPKVNLGPDLQFCAEQGATLKSSAGDTLLWQDGTVANALAVSSSGAYVASSLSAQCPSSDTIQVERVDCPGVIPNVFTPNGDGKNDFFVIENIRVLPWEFTVYNRWGKQIYYSQQYDNSWDGGDAAAGTYYFLLHNQSLNQSYKGWLTLLR